MMTAAKIVETVPWIDAKYYASTQTMDEARHTEVFAQYLSLKLGDAYPISPFLKEQIWSLLEDSRWDIAYLGMQIVIESLALAAFGDMLRRTEEPLLKKLLRYVMSDEARHVAFGVVTLAEFYAELSEAELLERQEFMVEATLRSRARATTPEVWDRLGVSEASRYFPYLTEAAHSCGINPARGFQRGFFAKLVPNVRKLGLLEANGGYLRRHWGDAGLLESEFSRTTPGRTMSATTRWRQTVRCRAHTEHPPSCPIRSSASRSAICLALPQGRGEVLRRSPHAPPSGCATRFSPPPARIRRT